MLNPAERRKKKSASEPRSPDGEGDVVTSDLPRLLQRDTSSRRITAALGPRTDGSGPPCVSADKASHGGAAAAGADQTRPDQSPPDGKKDFLTSERQKNQTSFN